MRYQWMEVDEVDFNVGVLRELAEMKPGEWRAIEHVLRELIERGPRMLSSAVDGFRSGGGDGGGGRGGSTYSSVEAAAIAGLSAGPVEHLEDQVRQLQVDLEVGARHLRSILASARLLASVAGHRLDVPDQCEACKAAGLVRDGDHFGTVGGRLDPARQLCDLCYEFVRRHGRCPEPDERRRREVSSSWGVRR